LEKNNPASELSTGERAGYPQTKAENAIMGSREMENGKRETGSGHGYVENKPLWSDRKGKHKQRHKHRRGGRINNNNVSSSSICTCQWHLLWSGSP